MRGWFRIGGAISRWEYCTEVRVAPKEGAGALSPVPDVWKHRRRIHAIGGFAKNSKVHVEQRRGTLMVLVVYKHLF